MNDDKPSRPCYRETVEVDLSDYIDLKIKPLRDEYTKSESGINQKAEEQDKRIEATYATLREVTLSMMSMEEKLNTKLETSLVRVYLLIFVILSILVSLISIAVAYLLRI